MPRLLLKPIELGRFRDASKLYEICYISYSKLRIYEILSRHARRQIVSAFNETLSDKVRITVIATGIDGNSDSIRKAAVPLEEDVEQISLNLEEDETEINNDLSGTEEEVSKIDELHPLGDDAHFEIPAFIRKPKGKSTDE